MEELQTASIVCPKCSGTGKNKMGFNCGDCGGIGMGKFFEGRFFYWKPKLGIAVVELDYLKNILNKVVNGVVFIIGLSGLLALGYWIFKTSNNYLNINAFYFWSIKDPLILFFWISILADLFMFYRLSEEERKRYKIKPLKYYEKIKARIVPNNWDDLKKEGSKYKIDVASGVDSTAYELIEKAYLFSHKLNIKSVSPLVLFYILLNDIKVKAVLTRLNVDINLLSEKIKKNIVNIPKKEVLQNTELSIETREALVSAYLQAYNLRREKVSTKNLLVPLVEQDDLLTEILHYFEVDSDKLFNVVKWFEINEKQVIDYREYRKLARYKPENHMNRAYTAVATPALDHYGYDLTISAKLGRLEYCVSRGKEIESIFNDFESGKQGLILVGEEGVGKKSIIHGIAQLMVKEDVPEILKDKRLIEIDATRLISGASPSEAEGRLVVIIDEVYKSGNIILSIENVEKIIGITSGTEESLDLSEILASAIDRNQIMCLATATRKNYISYIENKSLGIAMNKFDVLEPQGSQAVQIIASKISYFESKYNVYFSYNAIEDAIKLTNRYIHDKFLPKKAIDLLEKSALKASKTSKEVVMVTKNNIQESVSESTGIPVTDVDIEEGRKLLGLESEIHKRMIGQDEAVKMVSASLRRARTELREGKRPIASFLFLGPTGVGKTELAKNVAKVYFGDNRSMIRVDMSEYQHRDSVKKMIGGRSGTKGYLTELVRRAPFSMILLDEIEKAHSDILNLFLQVMDDGRLTDGQGNTVDFTNAIIIATSNAGALYIQEEIKKGTNIEEVKNVLINEHLNKVMKPELVNRFDGVIVFKPLSVQDTIDITKVMLKDVELMLENKGIHFRVHDEGVEKIAQMGYDPKFGARPLRRLIQEKIEDEIANKILLGDLIRRDTVIINYNAEVVIEKGREI